MSKLNEILSGWANVIRDTVGILDEQTKSVAEGRLNICNECSMRVHNSCSTERWDFDVKTKELKNGCGCNIAAKTLSMGSKCPLSKW